MTHDWKQRLLDVHRRDLASLKNYYHSSRNLYDKYEPWQSSIVASGAEVSTIVVAMLPASKGSEHVRAMNASELITELHKEMPGRMCSFWEAFMKTCEALGLKIGKDYNNKITELFCIRNCLAHNHGIVDDSHIDRFEKDEAIVLRAADIREFLRSLEESYNEVEASLAVYSSNNSGQESVDFNVDQALFHE